MPRARRACGPAAARTVPPGPPGPARPMPSPESGARRAGTARVARSSSSCRCCSSAPAWGRHGGVGALAAYDVHDETGEQGERLQPGGGRLPGGGQCGGGELERGEHVGAERLPVGEGVDHPGVAVQQCALLTGEDRQIRAPIAGRLVRQPLLARDLLDHRSYECLLVRHVAVQAHGAGAQPRPRPSACSPRPGRRRRRRATAAATTSAREWCGRRPRRTGFSRSPTSFSPPLPPAVELTYTVRRLTEEAA